MLYAESFVLLSLTPGGLVVGGAGNRRYVSVGVAGALISELIDRGHVELADRRIHVTGSRPTEPLLLKMLWLLEQSAGKKLRKRLTTLPTLAWIDTTQSMIAAGQLGHEKAFLRYTRYPVADTAGHHALVTAVQAAVAGDGGLDGHMATLLALAGPCNLLKLIAPDRAARPRAKQRIAQAAAQVPAAGPVREAIQALAAATSASS